MMRRQQWRAWPWPDDVNRITLSTRADVGDWVLKMDSDSMLHVWRLP